MNRPKGYFGILHILLINSLNTLRDGQWSMFQSTGLRISHVCLNKSSVGRKTSESVVTVWEETVSDLHVRRQPS